MSEQETNLEGLEPVESLMSEIPIVDRRLSTGLRINIRGRSVRLRGLKRQPKGLYVPTHTPIPDIRSIISSA